MVFDYDVLKCNLSEIFGEITWKYKIDELINKSFDSLNVIIGKDYLITVRTINLSNELLETLRIVENCTNCKDNREKWEEYNLDEFHELIDEIEICLANLEEEQEEQGKNHMIYELNGKLIEIDDELNKIILCESCKVEKIEKLTDKCENQEMARLLYDSKLNWGDHIQWIPFNEFKDIECLTEGSFGEIYKATWIDSYCYGKEIDVILKRLRNSSNKISNILKEVKV